MLFTVRNEDIEDIYILEEQLKAAKSNIALAETGVAAAMEAGSKVRSCSMSRL